MSKKRGGKYPANFKAMIVLEALSGKMTLSALAEKHSIQPRQIRTWCEVLHHRATELFESSAATKTTPKERDDLHEETIGLRNQLENAKREAEKRERQYIDTRKAALLEIQALELASERERSRRLQFVRDILHDIRGPLGALGGSVSNFRQAKAQLRDDLASLAADHIYRA